MRRLAILTLLFGAIIVLVLNGYRYQWTGFGESRTVTSPSVAVSPAKKLWDWMQLMIIPVALALGGYALNQGEKRREYALAERRAIVERDIASDRNREASLQAYFDAMTTLLLSGRLRKVGPDIQPGSADEECIRVNLLARARTLTILPTLDPRRRSSVFRFLAELQLIQRYGIIPLRDADFTGVDAAGLHLKDVDLSQAKLDDTNFSGAYLEGACLDRASMRRADFSKACLDGATALGTDLKSARLNDSSCAGAMFDGASLVSASATDAKFNELLTRDPKRNVIAKRTSIVAVDFSNATLDGATFEGAYAPDAKFAHASARGANFIRADLENADFTGAVTTGARFDSAS